MSTRKGASLIETIIVLGIISILLAFLFPAVLSAHRKAQEMVCKNNLHQIDLAIAEYTQLNSRLPDPGSNGVMGGWVIDVLPFLEQKNLRDRISPGQPIPTAPDVLLRRPRILTCPVRNAGEKPTPNVMEPSDYILVPFNERRSFAVYDAPLEVNIPWASGPEMTRSNLIHQIGPHHRGFFYAAGFDGGVGFILGGQDIQ